MTLPFSLPDWVPWWVPILLLVPALLYALAVLFMPFSVIGVKGRLDSIEARLDEIQGEIRSLSLRMPESPSRAAFDDLYASPPPEAPPYRPEPAVPLRPPIPPAARPFDEYVDPPAQRDLGQPPRRNDMRGDMRDEFRGRDDGRSDPRDDPRGESARRIARSGRSEPRIDWPR